MTTDAKDRPNDPKPPLSTSHIIAVLLELAIAGVFAYHHSLLGLALCVGYLWFSATYAALFDPVD